MESMNQIRGYAFILSALRAQQSDPFCRSCNSFAKVLTAARDGIAAIEAQNSEAIGGRSAELSRLFASAKDVLASLSLPEQTVGQKKAGNCKLPEGVCFLKSSLALVQKI